MMQPVPLEVQQQFEKRLDAIAQREMTNWNLDRLKQTHPALIKTIMQAMYAADQDFKKLVSDMRAAQTAYFKCIDSSRKKGLLAKATNLEYQVDRYRMQTEPQPEIQQSNLFE